MLGFSFAGCSISGEATDLKVETEHGRLSASPWWIHMLRTGLHEASRSCIALCIHRASSTITSLATQLARTYRRLSTRTLPTNMSEPSDAKAADLCVQSTTDHMVIKLQGININNINQLCTLLTEKLTTDVHGNLLRQGRQQRHRRSPRPGS